MDDLNSPVAGTGSLSRPRFTPGQLLEDDDLNAGVDYTRNVVRLLMRSLFGCGIVCGLGVKAELRDGGRKLCVTVEPGVAFDAAGNVIEVSKKQLVVLEDRCDPIRSPVWVTLQHEEKPCRMRDASFQDEAADERVSTRWAEGFRIELVAAKEYPEGACGCGRTDSQKKPIDCFDRTDPFDCGSCGCGSADGARSVVLAHIALTSDTHPQAQVNATINPRRLVRPVPAGAATKPPAAST